MGSTARPAVALLLLLVGVVLIWSALRWRARTKTTKTWTYMDRNAFLGLAGIGVIGVIGGRCGPSDRVLGMVPPRAS